MEEPENVSPVMLGADAVQQSLIVVVTKDSVSQVVSDFLIQFCYLLLVEFRRKFGSSPAMSTSALGVPSVSG
jgi:hypothetical protein